MKGKQGCGCSVHWLLLLFAAAGILPLGTQAAAQNLVSRPAGHRWHALAVHGTEIQGIGLEETGGLASRQAGSDLLSRKVEL